MIVNCNELIISEKCDLCALIFINCFVTFCYQNVCILKKHINFGALIFKT